MLPFSDARRAATPLLAGTNYNFELNTPDGVMYCDVFWPLQSSDESPEYDCAIHRHKKKACVPGTQIPTAAPTAAPSATASPIASPTAFSPLEYCVKPLYKVRALPRFPANIGKSRRPSFVYRRVCFTPRMLAFTREPRR